MQSLENVGLSIGPGCEVTRPSFLVDLSDDTGKPLTNAPSRPSYTLGIRCKDSTHLGWAAAPWLSPSPGLGGALPPSSACHPSSEGSPQPPTSVTPPPLPRLLPIQYAPSAVESPKGPLCNEIVLLMVNLSMASLLHVQECKPVLWQACVPPPPGPSSFSDPPSRWQSRSTASYTFRCQIA